MLYYIICDAQTDIIFPEVAKVNQTSTKEWKGEMLISTRKIWCNVKKYWLLGAAVIIACAALVGLMTFREYRADLAAAALETYQGEALVYIDSADEDYSDAYTALLYSERIRNQVNQALLENGFEKFNKKLDTANVDMKGTSMCYRVIVRSNGLERTRFLAEEYTKLLLQEAKDIMGLKGKVIDQPVMTTYLTKANGSVQIFELDEPRKVSLSLGSFLSWKKIMIMGAGFFLWCAFVMVRVFYDTTLRSRDEVDQISSVPCFCQVKAGEQASCDLLAVLLDGVAERIGDSGSVVLAAPGSGKALTAVYEGVKGALAARNSGVELILAEGAAVSAQALDQAKAAGAVFLFVTLDQDCAEETHQAFANLSTVGAGLLGYIAGTH